MEGDSRVYQVKPACSNEGRWEGDEWFGWGILSDVGSWFQRWGEACRKDRRVTLGDDDGLMKVTQGEERV